MTVYVNILQSIQEYLISMSFCHFFISGHATSCIMSISRYIIVKHGKDSKNQMIAFVVFIFIHVIIVLNVVAMKVLQITGHLDDTTLLREVGEHFVLN